MIITPVSAPGIVGSVAYSEFQQFVLDQLSAAESVRAKKMFGGVGVYVDEVFCAILSGSSRLYLRVDDGNRRRFEERGMPQFPGRGGAEMPYYEVPSEVLEQPEELSSSVGEARKAATRSAGKRRARPARKSP